jgi:hypothetical protein
MKGMFLHVAIETAAPEFTGHVWTDKDGETSATVRFDLYTDIRFDSAEAARQMAAACLAAAAAIEAHIEQLCRKCKTRTAASDGPYCRACADMCHEALEFDHLCMICATPEEARAHGWEVQ